MKTLLLIIAALITVSPAYSAERKDFVLFGQKVVTVTYAWQQNPYNGYWYKISVVDGQPQVMNFTPTQSWQSQQTPTYNRMMSQPQQYQQQPVRRIFNAPSRSSGSC